VATTPAQVQRIPASETLRVVSRDLVAEFDGVLAERVVLAYVAKAASAVTYFGDDPARRADWVAGIARNELNLLAGRDADRART
jgi:hypothetical protein